MPDDVIDKLHRMARQQKNNPGLVFADQNLNLDEYDDDEDDKTYHDDDDSTSDDDEDVLNYDKEEDNDMDEDEEETHGPPVGKMRLHPSHRQQRTMMMLTMTTTMAT